MSARPRSSLALLALVAASCGPSHRMVHQSNVRFERCHSAELAETVDTRACHECWDDWIRHHAEGQPPHRVRYARERMDALGRGETLRRLPDGTPVAIEVVADPSVSDTGGESDSATASAIEPPTRTSAESAQPAPAAPSASPSPEPAPPSASVAPEPAAPRAAASGVAEAAGPARTPRYAGDRTCQPVCGPPWDRCIARCGEGRTSCVTACENEYRACMGGCF